MPTPMTETLTTFGSGLSTAKPIAFFPFSSTATARSRSARPTVKERSAVRPVGEARAAGGKVADAVRAGGGRRPPGGGGAPAAAGRRYPPARPPPLNPRHDGDLTLGEAAADLGHVDRLDPRLAVHPVRA